MKPEQAIDGYLLPSIGIRAGQLRDLRDAEYHRPWRPGTKARPIAPYAGRVLHPSALCNFCSQINLEELLKAAWLDSRLLSNGVGGHHWSPQDLEESAARCPLCRMFREALESHWRQLVMTNSPCTVESARGQCRFKLWAWNGQEPSFGDDESHREDIKYLVLEWRGNCEAEAELRMFADQDTPAFDQGKIATMSISTTLDCMENWNRICDLWHTCRAEHQWCNYHDDDDDDDTCSSHSDDWWYKHTGAALPTRVVVADYELFDKKAPFLLETDGAFDTYFALSHCWGETTAVRTTRKNYSAHLEEIPFNEDSQSFRDAIKICRRLQVPYIWIDSLCIIQHDETDPLSSTEDFMREVKYMPQIYLNASITLAATGASMDRSMGLLKTNRNRLLEVIEVPFRISKNEEPDGIFKVSRVPEGMIKEVWNSKLLTRGWILQERLLSPRYLHFGREQWYWQCRESTTVEIEDAALSVLNHGADFDMMTAVLGDAVQFHQWWCKVAEAYSAMEFLLKRDKIIALEAFMSQIEKWNQKQFAGGMWLENLHIQLYWDVVRLTRPPEDLIAKKATGTRAIPSWSWLSARDPVAMHRVTEDAPESRIQYNFLPVPNMKKAADQQQLHAIPARLINDHVLRIRGQIHVAVAHPEYVPKGNDIPVTFADEHRRGPLQIMSQHDQVASSWFYIIARNQTVNPGKIEAERDIVGKCRFSTVNLSIDHRSSAIAFYCLRLFDNQWVNEAKSEREQDADVQTEKKTSYAVVLLQKRVEAKGRTPAVYCKVGTGTVTKVELFSQVLPQDIFLM